MKGKDCKVLVDRARLEAAEAVCEHLIAQGALENGSIHDTLIAKLVRTWDRTRVRSTLVEKG